MKFEELKEKFEKSNKYCLYLSYEDIYDLFIHIGKLKTRNTRQAIKINKLVEENYTLNDRIKAKIKAKIETLDYRNYSVYERTCKKEILNELYNEFNK